MQSEGGRLDCVRSEEASEKKLPAALSQIETLLKAKNWSRRELARQSKIDESTVQGWFQRQGPPGLEDAVRVAHAFGTTVEFLVTGKDPEPPDPEYVCLEQAQLVDWIRNMSRDEVVKLWALSVTRSSELGLPAMRPMAELKKEKAG